MQLYMYRLCILLTIALFIEKLRKTKFMGHALVQQTGGHCGGHPQHGRHHCPAHQGQEGEGTEEDI